MKSFFVKTLLILFIISCSKKEENHNKEGILTFPGNTNSSLPYFTKDINNSLYLSWVEKEKDSAFFYYAIENQSGGWSLPKKINEGNDWFVNWADFPKINVLDSQNIVSHVLKKSADDTYAYDVVLKTKTNGSWSNPNILHHDSTFTEHGFVSYTPARDNNKHWIFWLDGRETEDRENNPDAAMTLRGALLNNEGQKLNEWGLDSRVCDCCQTTATLTAEGPIVFYRNRSALEIRDIHYTRFVNGKWSEPTAISNDNWNIEGCPVNGPSAASYGETVAVGWFTAAHNKAAVKMAFSTDNGATFGEAITIDNQAPLGRISVQMKNEKEALLSWMTKEQENTLIKVAKVLSNGSIASVSTVVSTSEARKSGFPQLVVANESIYIAFTKLIDEKTTIQIKKVEI